MALFTDSIATLQTIQRLAYSTSSRLTTVKENILLVLFRQIA
ncbi:hypothetical protein D352_01600 [Enterococcus faecium LA4B-2]|nr:hypothetical protein D352_01600 [Enterococcus faecium LA4B-2]